MAHQRYTKVVNQGCQEASVHWVAHKMFPLQVLLLNVVLIL